MVILIGGASHTGKTALAQKLLQKHGCPYLSIDHLKMGLIRSGMTRLTPESPDEELTKLLWPILCGILYLLMGFLDILGGWGIGWLIFMTVPLYYTLGAAIRTRNAEAFAYPVLVTLIYLILGYSTGWWHPGWVLFLTIPVYYCICEAIQKNRK